MSERKDIIRTRRAIWQAYLQLSKKKAYTDITASDVIKNAKVSRGTFYGHYRDIGELREEIEQDFCAMTSCRTESLSEYGESLFSYSSLL